MSDIKLPQVRYETVGGIAPASLDEAWRLAQLFAKSELVPKTYRDKPENCLVAMQMGAEIGLKPLQALQGIAVVNGNPSVWGDALWALVQASPIVEDASETFDAQTMTATCTIKRAGRSQPTVVLFSKTDAEKASLWGKAGPWQTNPKRMLQLRARAFAARDAVPDVLKGMKVAEEVMDYQEIDVTPVAPKKTGTEALKARLAAQHPDQVALTAESLPAARSDSGPPALFQMVDRETGEVLGADPTIVDVRAAINRGEFDIAADLARSLPDNTEALLEVSVAHEKAKKS